MAKKAKKLKQNERASSIQRYPLTVERKFQRELSRTVSELHSIVKEFLIPELHRIRELAKLEDARFDDAGDDLYKVLADLKIRMQDRYPEELLEDLARRRGLEISQQSIDTLRMQVNQVQGVDIFMSDRALRSRLTGFTKQNVNLIQTVHQSYFKDVQTIVTNGVGSGESVKSMASKISKRTGVSQSRAKLIARDQTGKLNGGLNASRQAELGVKKFKWTTAGDEKVRHSHSVHNGKIYSWNNPPTIDGEKAIPGQPINCRCVALPVFEKE